MQNLSVADRLRGTPFVPLLSVAFVEEICSYSL
jgi:hypothetical protein